MFKNKCEDGRNNISGMKMRELRLNNPTKMSQRMLADVFQCRGIDIDKNAVQRMESGQRFITDIELLCIADIFAVTVDELLR